MESEAAVIASLLSNPEFIYYSEDLLPGHFYDTQNRAIYIAIQTLVEQGVKNIDPFNIITALESNDSTRRLVDELPLESLEEWFDVQDVVARNTVEEYMLNVKNILDAALRRDVYKRLRECEALCLDRNAEDVQQKIYTVLDDVMIEYSTTNDVPPFKDVVDDCWSEIQKRQGEGCTGIPFKFPTLNEFATIERGELFIFAAEAKQGKSMMLLNCAVDLLRRGQRVLYLDSELNTRLFTARILAHLSGVEFKRLTAGAYTEEEEVRINQALAWIKEQPFTHIYIPIFDQQTIYTAVKKVNHTQGIDVLIVDYFKDSGRYDAYETYAELGKFSDTVKNKIAGDMNIAAIGAAQATSGGKVAGSAKIGRNASTLAFLLDKTPEEIEIDGPECGNKKLYIALNRNGMQMAPGEYIDLRFDGNHILYEEAKQHIPQNPW